MKSFKTIIALLVLSFSLIACSSNNSPKEENNVELKIYLVRHGKTMLNTTDRAQGWIDAPLTPAGIEKMEETAEKLKDVPFDLIYSSDSGRAIETAEIILAAHKNEATKELPVNKNKGFREVNFGAFEGVYNDELTEISAEYLNKTFEEYNEDMLTSSFYTKVEEWSDATAAKDKEITDPKVNWLAEDYSTVKDRTRKALDDLVKEMEETSKTNALVTSHGMAIGALIATIDESFPLPEWGPSNGDIYEITYKDGTYTIKAFK